MHSPRLNSLQASLPALKANGLKMPTVGWLQQQ
jgi:hypothetical protein